MRVAPKSLYSSSLTVCFIRAAAIAFITALSSSASASCAPGKMIKDLAVDRGESPVKKAPELEIDEEDKPKFQLSIGSGRTEYTCQTVTPAYPEACKARAKALEQVLIEFNIDPNGEVVGAVAADSTNDCFDTAAIEAVSRWRCEPKLDEDDVSIWQRGRLTLITFLLSEN